MFDPQYEVEFNGGFVFEYSTEKVYSESQDPDTSSEWPFDTHGPGNYGVGYYEPVDCDDETIPCSYVRFPQFDLLAQEYASADETGGRPTLETYTPGAVTIPACPANFPALDQFTWPSASVEDQVCWDDGGFQCPSCGGSPATPEGSPAPSTANADMTPEPSTAVPGTVTSSEPSSLTMDTSVPTASPSMSPGDSTPSPTGTAATEGPTVQASPSPTRAPIDLENLPDVVPEFVWSRRSTESSWLL